MNPYGGGRTVVPTDYGIAKVGKRIPYGNWKERIYCCLAIDVGTSFPPPRRAHSETSPGRNGRETWKFRKNLSFTGLTILMRFSFRVPPLLFS